MRWTIGDQVVTWDAGVLEGPPWLVDDIEELARSGEVLAPIPCTSIPAGLIDPLEAWATVTVALSEDRDPGTVQTPPPPEALGPEGEDLVF